MGILFEIKSPYLILAAFSATKTIGLLKQGFDDYRRKSYRNAGTSIEFANEVSGVGWGGWEIAKVSGGIRNIRPRDVSSWERSPLTTLPWTYIPVD